MDMQSFTLEFEERGDLELVAARLWERLGITGEMELKRLEDGRWRVEVWAENGLPRGVLKGLRVAAG
ncbi:MAG: hypothetical protein K6T75_02460 [Acetobacteraceae bacterium]|nr:hypothetical protein [Acetobacteraceae bacterium]